MTEEEVAVRLETHEQNIKSLKHRMEKQEEESKSFQELVLSVQKLACSVEQMVKEQKQQGERLQKLEDAPANAYKNIKMSVITSIISAVVGVVLGAILTRL